MTRNIELHGAMAPGFDEVITADALEFVAELQHRFDGRRRELLRGARRPARSAGPRGVARLPARDASDPRGRLDRRARTRGPAAAVGRDHRPDRPQDDDQRAELGRRRVHGRLRGRQRPDLAQHDRRASQPPRRDRRDDHLPRLRGQGLRARGRIPATLLVRPRGWHLPERHLLVDSEPVSGVAVRLRPVRVPLRTPPAPAAGPRPTSTCRRWSRISRPGCGTTCSCFAQERARHPARDDQGDRADRDAAGRVRDGRDPVRAARALRRAERRPLGLHLLLDQVLPRPPRDGPARPRRRDDDRAVHARLHRAAGRDLPQARGPRDGRDVRADPEPQGRRGGQREGARRGPQGQGARGLPGLRRHLGRASGPRAGRARGVRAGLDGAPNQLEPPARRRPRDAPRSCSISPRPRARSPRRACGPTSTSASSTSRSG